MTSASAVERWTRDVSDRLFAPSGERSRRIGAEVEVIPVLADGGGVCPLEAPADGGPSTLPFLRRYGVARGWMERRSSKGAPYFSLPSGSTLTFEPGGQIELGSLPCQRASELVAELQAVLCPLRSAANDDGIALLSLGIDPRNAIAQAPLQIASDRYRRMDAFFRTRGESGARMMRQTAATQVSLDAGPDPCARWRLLGDLAPYLTAVFANSARYAGRDTGHRSFRAHCWRTLDSSRTGIPWRDLPASVAYARFAAEAYDIARVDATGTHRAFGDWEPDEEGAAADARWEMHLTTLFPEVRPRGYLEVRSIDALPPEWIAAPIVLLSGLTYSESAEAAVREAMGPADEELLRRAGQCGLHDAEIARVANDVVAIGLAGAAELGAPYIEEPDLEAARDYFSRFTCANRSPADERTGETRTPAESGRA